MLYLTSTRNWHGSTEAKYRLQAWWHTLRTPGLSDRDSGIPGAHWPGLRAWWHADRTLGLSDRQWYPFGSLAGQQSSLTGESKPMGTSSEDSAPMEGMELVFRPPCTHSCMHPCTLMNTHIRAHSSDTAEEQAVCGYCGFHNYFLLGLPVCSPRTAVSQSPSEAQLLLC